TYLTAHTHLDKTGLFERHRFVDCPFEFSLGIHLPGAHAKRPGKESEVRILQIHAQETALVTALLNRLDQRQAPVVDNDDVNRQLFLHRRRQFHAAHHKTAVTRNSDDGTLREGRLGADGSWQAIPHGDEAGWM